MQSPEDIVPVNDIDQFAFLVTSWHMNRIAQLQQSLAMPDDVEVSADLTGMGVDTPLTAEQREGFKVGLTVALSLFQVLPFTVTESVPSESEVPSTEAPTHG